MTTVDADLDMEARVVHFRVRRELDVVPITFDVAFHSVKMMAGVIAMDEAKVEASRLQARDTALQLVKPS